MSLADELESVRAELAVAAPEFLPDLCSIVTVSDVQDGFGGPTETETVVAANVPCKYEAMTNPMQKQVGAGPISTLTHILTLPSTAITKIIQPHHRIVVEAQNGQPQLVFRSPVTLDGSFSVFTKLAAEFAESAMPESPNLLLVSGGHLLLQGGGRLLLNA